MGLIGETVDSIKSLQIRQVLTQGVSLGSFSFSLSLSLLKIFFLIHTIKILFLRFLTSIWELHWCGATLKTYNFDVLDVNSSL